MESELCRSCVAWKMFPVWRVSIVNRHSPVRQSHNLIFVSSLPVITTFPSLVNLVVFTQPP